MISSNTSSISVTTGSTNKKENLLDQLLKEHKRREYHYYISNQGLLHSKTQFNEFMKSYFLLSYQDIYNNRLESKKILLMANNR